MMKCAILSIWNATFFRSSQTINLEPSAESLRNKTEDFTSDSNNLDATRNLNSQEIKTKKKKRGLISSLKRPLKRFNSSKSLNLSPAPISTNNSSQIPQWKRIDSTESINKKKSFKKSNSLLSINSTSYNSNSSLQSVSGGSNFSLNKLVGRKKLKTLDESLR